jgi:hypothetical protein
MNILDTIMAHIFARYTKKIYRKGYVDGFNWKV